MTISKFPCHTQEITGRCASDLFEEERKLKSRKRRVLNIALSTSLIFGIPFLRKLLFRYFQIFLYDLFIGDHLEIFNHFNSTLDNAVEN